MRVPATGMNGDSMQQPCWEGQGSVASMRSLALPRSMLTLVLSWLQLWYRAL